MNYCNCCQKMRMKIYRVRLSHNNKFFTREIRCLCKDCLDFIATYTNTKVL